MCAPPHAGFGGEGRVQSYSGDSGVALPADDTRRPTTRVQSKVRSLGGHPAAKNLWQKKNQMRLHPAFRPSCASCKFHLLFGELRVYKSTAVRRAAADGG